MELTSIFKDGMVELTHNYNIQTVIMGVRVGDPFVYNTIDAFQRSSADWPEFMRVYPILHWSYHYGMCVYIIVCINVYNVIVCIPSIIVWLFLRKCSLPYCILYDLGYTSIGNITNTIPNPALLITNDQGQVIEGADSCKYNPAYTLVDGSLERTNRK